MTNPAPAMQPSEIDISGIQLPVLNLLIFREHATKRWVVRALNHNVTASGETSQEALLNFDYIVTAHIAMAEEFGTPLFNGLSPAPAKYWEMYKKAVQSNSFGLPMTRQLGRIFNDEVHDAFNGNFELTIGEDLVEDDATAEVAHA